MTPRKTDGPTVAEIKAAVRQRDGFCCTKCGMTNDDHHKEYGKQLDVHRVIPGSVYTADACITLCRSCHGPQPRRKQGEPDLGSSRSGVPLHVWIDPTVAQALRAYLANTDPAVFKTSAVETALREFLRAKVFWPLADQKETK